MKVMQQYLDIQFTYIKIIFFHNSVNTDKNFKVQVSNKLLNNLIKQFVRNWGFFSESLKHFLIWGLIKDSDCDLLN